MPREIGSLHLVGDNASRSEAALLAGKQVPAGGAVTRSSDLSAASRQPERRSEVLLLLDPTAEAIEAALAVVDRRGLPRWAVVPATAEDARSPAFATAQWDPALLVPAIRSALDLLALRRENARLRGDLATLGRRLTHDLRTPLGLISAANETLGETEPSGEAGLELHQAIAASVREAGSLVDRVGTVYLASVRPVKPQPLEMRDVVWNALQRVDDAVRRAGATVNSSDDWPVVSGVAAWLELVWTNLLLNSLQHGGPTPRIAIGWQRTAEEFRFWIRDSGPGVDPAKRQLFHPLDRLCEPNAPRGYGLSLIHRLVELQSGTTGYDRDPTPGGTFFFTLPTGS